MTVRLKTAHPDPAEGWKANLELCFSRHGDKTEVIRNRHQGPLRLQRPLYPEPEVCHALILHPPGGVVGGDRLAVNVDVEDGASALITTPGATKFYRSGGRRAGQINLLRIEHGGCLEWLPQETIIYPNADATACTRVELAADAGFMGWEILCLGLPACGEPFAGGRFVARLEIDRQGRPIFRDRLDIDGADGLQRPTGLHGFAVSATIVATGVTPAMRDALRRRLDEKTDTLWGLTLMDDLLVVRMLDNDSARLKQRLQRIWTWLRPNVFGRDVCVPRIWET